MAVVGSSVELSFLADQSIHGKEKVVAAMRDMDADSPYPKDGVDYSTLWCRFIHWTFKDITMKLHDYPQPLVELKEGSLVRLPHTATMSNVLSFLVAEICNELLYRFR